MTVTWTSGYNIGEAVPFVEWGALDGEGVTFRSPAGTFTYTRNQMCGMNESRMVVRNFIRCLTR